MALTIHLLLVDALNLIRRIHAAQGGGDEAQDEAQGVSEAREASVKSLRRALGECGPTHAVVVFDGAGATWRQELFPEYKAGRRPMPAALAAALPSFREAFLKELGVASFEREATEADDVIATLASKVAAAGGRATILSTDKGYLPLLSEAIGVRDHFRPLDLGRGHVRERFGVEPERLLDLFALSGDSTSSIPGVPGIGPKTAAALLAGYGSLDALIAAAQVQVDGESRQAGEALTPRLAAKLVAHADAARLARRLVEPTTDLELGLNLRELRLASG